METGWRILKHNYTQTHTLLFAAMSMLPFRLYAWWAAFFSFMTNITYVVPFSPPPPSTLDNINVEKARLGSKEVVDIKFTQGFISLCLPFSQTHGHTVGLMRGVIQPSHSAWRRPHSSRRPVTSQIFFKAADSWTAISSHTKKQTVYTHAHTQTRCYSHYHKHPRHNACLLTVCPS